MKFDKVVIDSHIHLYNWFSENGKDFFSSIDEYQKRFNLKALNLCALPNVYSDVSSNIMCAIYKLHNPTAYSYGGFVYPEFPVKPPLPAEMDALTQYNELMEIGFDGIKLIESKPFEYKLISLPFTDEFYSGFFAQAEKDATHIIWHVADPETFWDRDRIPERFIERGWFYGDGTYPSLEQIYGEVFEILKKHPKLKAQFAHFFFWSEHPERLEKLFSKYENVSIDIVPGAEMYESFNNNYDFYRNFFIKNSERIVYGTDVSFTYDDMERYNRLTDEVYRSITSDTNISIYQVDCKGLNLPDDVCENILHNNFIKACHPTPNTINKAALKKYIDKYKHLIKNEASKKMILDFAEKL